MLVNDDKNADGAMDVTLGTPTLTALTGKLDIAYLYSSPMMLTLALLYRIRHTLLSISDSNVWPA